MVEFIVSLLLLAPLAAAVVLIARGQLLRGLAIPTTLGLAAAALNWVAGGGAAAWVEGRPTVAIVCGGVLLGAVIANGLRGLLFHRRAFRRMTSAHAADVLDRTEPEFPPPTLDDRWVGAGAPLRALRGHRIPAEADRPTAEEDALTSILARLPELEGSGNAAQALWGQLSSAGLLGLGLPPEFGGRGLRPGLHSDLVAAAAGRSLFAAEALASSGPGSAVDLIDAFGTGEQRQTCLRLAASGDLFVARGWSAGRMDVPAQATATVVRSRGTLGVEVELEATGVELVAQAGMLLIVAHVHDPDGLLTDEAEREDSAPIGGPTCFLIRADEAAGLRRAVEPGPAHGFPRGTIEANGLFVPLTSVLGGPDAMGLGAIQLRWSGARLAGWRWPALAAGVANHSLDVGLAHRLALGSPSATADSALAGAATSARIAEAARRSAAERLDEDHLAETEAVSPDDVGQSWLVAAGWSALGASAHAVRSAGSAIHDGAATGYAGGSPLRETASWPVVAATRAAELEPALLMTVRAPYGARLSLDSMAEHDAVRTGGLAAYSRVRRRRAMRRKSLAARAIVRLARRVLPSSGPSPRQRIADLGVAFGLVNEAFARAVPTSSPERSSETAAYLGHAHAGLVAALALLEVRRADGEQPSMAAQEELALSSVTTRAARDLERAAASLTSLPMPLSRWLARGAGALPASTRRALLAQVMHDLERHHDLRERSVGADGGQDGCTLEGLLRAATLARGARGALEVLERGAGRGQLSQVPASSVPPLVVGGRRVSVEQLEEAVNLGLISDFDRGCVVAADGARRALLLGGQDPATGHQARTSA